jgi:predicted nucleic acid-binding protein
MNYADTGFLVSLYLPETTSASATAETAQIKQPFVLTPLLRLELRNALNFAISRGRLEPVQRDRIWQQIEVQELEGFFVKAVPPASDLYSKAQELSDRYTPNLATRSLDLLHVAAALLVNARGFFSFDERQRRAASAEGLQVRP